LFFHSWMNAFSSGVNFLGVAAAHSAAILQSLRVLKIRFAA